MSFSKNSLSRRGQISKLYFSFRVNRSAAILLSVNKKLLFGLHCVIESDMISRFESSLI